MSGRLAGLPVIRRSLSTYCVSELNWEQRGDNTSRMFNLQGSQCSQEEMMSDTYN